MDWLGLLIPLKIVVFCVILVVIYRMMSGWNSIQTLEAPGRSSQFWRSSHCSWRWARRDFLQSPKLLNSPVSTKYYSCSRSIASPTGRAGSSWRRWYLGKVIHKIIKLGVALNLDSYYIVIGTLARHSLRVSRPQLCSTRNRIWYPEVTKILFLIWGTIRKSTSCVVLTTRRAKEFTYQTTWFATWHGKRGKINGVNRLLPHKMSHPGYLVSLCFFSYVFISKYKLVQC